MDTASLLAVTIQITWATLTTAAGAIALVASAGGYAWFYFRKGNAKANSQELEVNTKLKAENAAIRDELLERYKLTIDALRSELADLRAGMTQLRADMASLEAKYRVSL